MTSELPAETMYRLQWTRCGREKCRICRSGGQGHGPYWYAYWTDAATGRQQSRYLGKHHPTSDATESEMAVAFAVAPQMRIFTLGEFAIQQRSLVADQQEESWHTLPPNAWRRSSALLLLKYLLTLPGRVATREQVMEALWPESDPQHTANSLNVALHALRRTLISLSGTPTLLTSNRTLIGLADQDQCWVDADAFANLTHALDTHAGDEATSTRRKAALALYRGDFLREDRYLSWATTRREHLRRLWTSLILAAADEALTRADLDCAHDYLEQLLSLDLAHEAAAERLMWILTCQGRRTDALRLAQTVRLSLATEFALPASSDFEATVTAATQETDSDHPQIASTRKSVWHLATRPSKLSVLIGRDDQLELLVHLLSTTQHRRIALVGLSGSGKTALARAVMVRMQPHFSGGIVTLSLEDHLSSEHLLTDLANQIGIPSAVWLKAPVAAHLPLLQRAFAHRDATQGPCLLFLDNGERLTKLASVSDLLDVLPYTWVLIATRIRPALCRDQDNVHWEEIEVTGLSRDDAIHLFMERARQHGGESSLRLADPEQRSLLTEICTLLEGSPLGIELLTGKVQPSGNKGLSAMQLRPLSAIRDELAAARSPVLDAVLGPLWGELREQDRRVVGMLGLTSLPIIPEATALALFMTLDPLESTDSRCLTQWHEVVQQLVRCYLLHVTTSGYELHPLIARFARVHLAVDDVQRTHVALAQHYCRGDATTVVALQGIDHLRAAWEVRNDEHLLPAALEMLLGQIVRLAAGGPWHEWVPHCECAIEWARRLEDPIVECQAWYYLALLRSYQGHLDSAEATLSRVRALARSIHDPRTDARAHRLAGLVAERRGQYTRAQRKFAQARTLFHAIDAVAEEARAYNDIAIMQIHLGAYQRARQQLQRALKLAQGLEDKQLEMATMQNLGALFVYVGKYGPARQACADALKIAVSMENCLVIAMLENNLGVISLYMEDFAAAETHLSYALSLKQSLGDDIGISISQLVLGQLAYTCEKFVEAATFLHQALDTIERLQQRDLFPEVWYHLGELAWLTDNFPEAQRHFCTVLTLTAEDKELVNRRKAYRGLARLSAAQGNRAGVLEYWPAALAITQQLHHHEFAANWEEALNDAIQLGVADHLLILTQEYWQRKEKGMEMSAQRNGVR